METTTIFVARVFPEAMDTIIIFRPFEIKANREIKTVHEINLYTHARAREYFYIHKYFVPYRCDRRGPRDKVHGKPVDNSVQNETGLKVAGEGNTYGIYIYTHIYVLTVFSNNFAHTAGLLVLRSGMSIYNWVITERQQLRERGGAFLVDVNVEATFFFFLLLTNKTENKRPNEITPSRRFVGSLPNFANVFRLTRLRNRKPVKIYADNNGRRRRRHQFVTKPINAAIYYLRKTFYIFALFLHHLWESRPPLRLVASIFSRFISTIWNHLTAYMEYGVEA